MIKTLSSIFAITITLSTGFNFKLSAQTIKLQTPSKTSTVGPKKNLNTAPRQKTKLEEPSSPRPKRGTSIVIPSDSSGLVKQIESQAEPVIENTPTGTINWTTQVIEVKGNSVLDTSRFKNPAQARLMAIQGARVDAQRKLLETVKGVNVKGETTVKDMITTSDEVKTRVEGVLVGAYSVGDPVVKDGVAEVIMKIDIYGPKGLAGAVHDEIIKDATAARGMANEENVTTAYAGNESTKLDSDSLTVNSSSTTTLNEKPLVFNLNGKKIDPSMFPVVVGPDGSLLLDMAKIYDPKKGNMPKYVKVAKEICNTMGFKKGSNVLNVLDASNGKITIDAASVKKVNWKKIGYTIGKITKFLLLFI